MIAYSLVFIIKKLFSSFPIFFWQLVFPFTFLQGNLYYSNHIEGSKLSEEQTRLIFETNTIAVGEAIPVDDIIETVNHFRAIDFCIDVAEESLTEDIIKELHRILKQSTKDSSETAKPEDAAPRMKALLSGYEAKTAVMINDIIHFHYAFESIHPFQDGNGIVVRLIALKECLRFGLIPFIIEDDKKMYYYRGLSEWEWEKGYLTDTCLDGQDTFRKLMSMFDIQS